jgi:hypothetical protein
MKFGPRRAIGLAAILVFGGILVFSMMETPRDPSPDSDRTNDAPSPIAPSPNTPSPEPSSAPPTDPMEIGSQDARDDLYCSGVVFAVHQSKSGETINSPEAQKRRDAVIGLAISGIGKLKDEGVATDDTSGPIADVHSARAAEDFAAGAPRLSFDACMARADAVLAPVR